MRMEFEPRQEPVKNLIAEGLTLFCGPSKLGKSWFVLDMCCSVSTGRPFLGRETLQGDVLYLALEDTQKRLQSRLRNMGESPVSNLQYDINALTLNSGLLEQMEDWVSHTQNPRMLVVDTLAKVRDPAPIRANCYALD